MGYRSFCGLGRIKKFAIKNGLAVLPWERYEKA